MIDRLVGALSGLEPQPTAEELADALWLAGWLREHEDVRHPPPDAADEPSGGAIQEPVPGVSPTGAPAEPILPPSRARPAEAELYLAGNDLPPESFSVRAPAIPALPGALRLARALRPLRITTPSLTQRYLDEAATAQRIAETGICEPIMLPAQERRHHLDLVVDANSSMVVWRRTVEEFQALLEQLGAFRDVRVWYLDGGGRRLSLRPASAASAGWGRSPDELVDPTRRRVVLVFTDCIGSAWQDGRAAALLDRWGRSGPVAIVQPLPQRLWRRTMVTVEPVRFTAPGPSPANDRLIATPAQSDRSTMAAEGIAVPVVELSERWLRPWAEMIAHGGHDIMGAAVFTGRPAAEPQPIDLGPGLLSAEERVKRFRASSSPTAFRLATFLAAAPLRLPVMRLVQQAMLPGSSPAHLAEVFLGDLLVIAGRPADGGDEEIAYEFHDGVREILLGGVRRREVLQVLRAVWDVVRGRIGSSLDFAALLSSVQHGERELHRDLPFARVAAQALARLGGRYREIAAQLVQPAAEPAPWPMAAPPGDATDPPAGPLAGPPADPHGGPGPSASMPVLRGGLPPRNPDFTGRDHLLTAVREALEHGMAALLPPPVSGVGGEGKSQLAVEYAYRFTDDYDLVWWIPAEQTTSARAALALLARQLGTPLSDDVKDTVDGVLRALRDGRPYRRWLLIYDNAQDPGEVLPITPLSPEAGRNGPAGLAPGGHVLVTSRDREWERHASVVDVGVFERAESVSLLKRLVPRLSDGEADLLSQRVGDLPIAVRQAAAWQVVTGGTAGDYITLFDERLAGLPEQDDPSGLPEPDGSGDLPRPLAVSVGLTLERLRESDPVALLLLTLWAVFGPEPVSCRLLGAGCTAALPAELSALLADEGRLRAAMSDIARFSLARFDEEDGNLQVHRLVRAILDARLTADERHNVRGYVHGILAAATPGEGPDVESTWQRRAEITPHVVPSGVFDSDGPDIQRVGIDQAQYLYQSGDFEGSRALAEIALSRWRKRYGPNSEAVLDISRTLANALRGLGDNRAAADLSEDTLARMRRRFGADHMLTLWAATSYGADLRFRGEFRRAHQVDLDAWRRMRSLYGDDDSNTLLAANNLGVDLRVLGEFQAAYDIDLDVLRRQERSGHSYRSKFRATHHVARDLHALGRYQEAYRLQAASLGDLRPVLAPGHALVLQAKMSHASTLRKLGRYAEARGLAADTLTAHVRRFGAEHPNTLASKVCLALALAVRSDGDAPQALRLMDEALAGCRRVMGAQHPFVHVFAVDRAVVLRGLGDVYAAQETDQMALAAFREGVLGPNHYYAHCAAVGLAHDLYLLGEPESAADVLAEVHEHFVRTLGDHHPYALISAHNAERIRAAMGLADQDAARRRPALAHLLGPAHPEVLAAARGELLDCEIEPIAL